MPFHVELGKAFALAAEKIFRKMQIEHSAVQGKELSKTFLGH